MSAKRTELLLIDSRVAEISQLTDLETSGLEIHLLDGARDGLTQIADLMAGRQDIDALHVISHGAQASIQMGSGHLTIDGVRARSGELASVGEALRPGGDILIYGCEVGAGDGGAAFVEALRAATGANIAASIGLTGAARLGGDWSLERTAGAVATPALHFPSYDGVLPSIAGTVSLRGQLSGDPYGTILTDGEGGSTDISGIQYNMIFADGAGAPLEGIHYSASNPIDVVSADNEGTSSSFIIYSGGGEEFDLQSYYYQDYFHYNANWTATAYRDGIQVGVQNYTVTQTGNVDVTVSLSSDFNNVDWVVVTATGGGSGGHIWGGFNDFVFGDAIAADVTPPTVGVVVSDGNLLAGETSLVTFTFSEAVTGFANNDLTIANGALSAVGSLDGGITWTATLTPTASVSDASNAIAVNLAGVTDAAGNAGVGSTNSNNYIVDTVRPTATIVMSDTALKLGETSLVTFTFSEAVTGFANNDLTIDNGALTTVATSDGGITWTATFTPTASTTDAGNLITLTNSGVVNASGNTGVASTVSSNYAIDNVVPTAAIAFADASLTRGETSLVTFAFSEAVTGFANNDLTIVNGTLSAVGSLDGGITWTATLTPTADVADATNVIVLNRGGLTDLAGNAGVGSLTSGNYTIDTMAPAPPAPTGTTGADSLTGDDQNNVIAAGDGADSVAAGAGADSVAGGEGDDILQGNSGADSIAGGAGGDFAYGGRDNDVLQGNSGGDHLFGDAGADTVMGGQGADTVQGGMGADYVFGDAGDDIVRGGQGDDWVIGGDGADFLSGDLGADTMTGGLGADVFHSFAGAGRDLVTDFSRAAGDRVMLDLGTSYSLSQSGADTVITMTGGALVLANVQLSSLSGDWIVA